MSLELMLLVFCIILFLSLAFLNRKHKWKLPKGPRGLPLLGNLLQIVKNPHLQFSKWAEEFGSLYTIKLGNKRVLVMADPHYAKEILNNVVSTGKFKNDTFLLLSRGPYGILKTDGKVWAEQRRFCMQTLKSLGFDGKSLEPVVLSEAQCLVDWIKLETSKVNDCAVILKSVLRLVAINSIWTIVSGERLPLEDSALSKTLEEFMTAFQNSMKTGLGFFPWLKYVATEKSGYNALDKASQKLHTFIGKYFSSHNKDSFKSGESNDLITAYIQHMRMETNPNSSFYGEAGEKHSVAVAAELFIAGSETIANTINWLIFYVSVQVDVQRKMLKEINEVLGKSTEPSIADRSKMPYTEAVILETLRYSSMVHMGTINQLLEDFEYKGYYIPKGTLLLCPMYHIHHDKKVWRDPGNFRPERFLESGSAKLKTHLIPFLVGKRTCLADFLAKDILFLFVTKIFQNFYVETHPNVSKEEYFEPDVGQVLLAPELNVVMHSR